MPASALYVPKSYAERLIAGGRVVVAVFCLLTISVDPSGLGRHFQLAEDLVAGYAVYAALMGLLVWRLPKLPARLGFITHVFDLTIFSLFLYFTSRSMSAFGLFVFSIICATVRWEWRGTLWTAVAALAIYIGLGLYEMEIQRHPDFGPYRHMVRTIYLAGISIMLGYLGIYQERHRRALSMLAAWPKAIPFEPHAMVLRELEHACTVLRAPRLLMAWNEGEEPYLHLALWSRGELEWTREPPNKFEPLVAGPLSGSDFFCKNLHAPNPTVLHTSSTGFQMWRGLPLNAGLKRRFADNTVLSLTFYGKKLEGRLFFLDKQGLASDDLLLGQVVARAVVARMTLFYLIRQLEHAAAAEARLRVSFDLHDGLLQSLALATIKLDTVYPLLEVDPLSAMGHLKEIERLLRDEQDNLRSFIRDLKSASGDLPQQQRGSRLITRIEGVVKQVEEQWGLRVRLTVAGLNVEISETLMHEIYYLVREALLNAARHAGASSVGVELGVDDRHVRITVADNGHGFPFHGQFDHTTLVEEKMGPLTLKGRITSLGGSLVIESSEKGARLDITIPLPRDEV